MKRMLCLFLCLCLPTCLIGCKAGSQEENLTSFYYCQAVYDCGTPEAVIAPEQRELSAGTPELKNILALYLVGPLDEKLTSPFYGVKLLSVENTEEQLLIQLTEADKSMTDAQFSLACACMTMTCLELTDVSQVTITCGDRSATMSLEKLLLFDGIAPIETTEETK